MKPPGESELFRATIAVSPQAHQCHCTGMPAGTGTAASVHGALPSSSSRILGVFLTQSALLFANDAGNLQEVQRVFFFFFLAIFTLPLKSVIHLFCHFFQNHLNNVSTSKIRFASWLSPKYWAL